jgi:hypothetical protein
MAKFPVDAPKARVLRALKALGFEMVREQEHISLERLNSDGTRTPLTVAQPQRDQSLHPPNNLPPVGHR